MLVSHSHGNLSRSFHELYLEMCRLKNMKPLKEIRPRKHSDRLLNFDCDKFGFVEWEMICEALQRDEALEFMRMRLRKDEGPVVESVNTERKARFFRSKPVIYTKFVFSDVVGAIAKFVQHNKNLKALHLENLPFTEEYAKLVAKALASNESIREVSFQKSSLKDSGCEAVCNAVKPLDNVVKLNLSGCQITANGAGHVAELIRIQKIRRYTVGWQDSLRYRTVNVEGMQGLRTLLLSRNPQIGDEGLQQIVEILKEDVWVKVIEMQQCGLTDRGADLVRQCLAYNNYIAEFDVSGNPGLSKGWLTTIAEQLGKDVGDRRNEEDKPAVKKLIERLQQLEGNLQLECVLKKRATDLNARMQEQLYTYDHQLESQVGALVPYGYVAVKKEALLKLINGSSKYELVMPCSNVLSRLVGKKQQPGGQLPVYGIRRKDRQIEPDRVVELQASHAQMQLKPDQMQGNKSRKQPFQSSTPEMLSNNDRNRQSSQNQASMAQNPASMAQNPASGAQNQAMSENPPRSASAKVRKARSEMKFVEPPPKGGAKNHDSKSDNEFATDNDLRNTGPPMVRFETNIGDSILVASTSSNRGLAQAYDDLGNFNLSLDRGSAYEENEYFYDAIKMHSKSEETLSGEMTVRPIDPGFCKYKSMDSGDAPTLLTPRTLFLGFTSGDDE